jgi:signal transduction histidine kinase
MLPFDTSLFQNLDLLSVGIAVAGMVVLGFVTLFNNTQSISNKSLFYLAISAGIWGIVNYASYDVHSADLSFRLLQMVMFLGVWSSFFTYTLTYVFPDEKITFSNYYKYFVVPLTIVTALICLTPLVFSGILQVAPDGHVTKVANGYGIILYGITSLILNLGGILILLRKIKHSDLNNRQSLKIVLYGMILMLTLILAYNFIFPAFLNNSSYIPLGALFLFPFIAFTSYAILKHRLFNIRVAIPAILIFTLASASFLEIIYAGQNLSLILFRIGVFMLILLSGVLLIKGVIREIYLREEVQAANEGQANLIHIMNHQIKGYLSKSRSIFGELLTGDYGPVTDEAKPMLEEGLKSLTEGVDFVQQVLNGSSAESGKLVYNFENFNFKDVVEDTAHAQGANAKSKGLEFKLDVHDGSYDIRGDKLQLKEAVRNLIDNSVSYTLEGSIHVSLERSGEKILLKVIDTGVGISPEDKPRLFTKGGRGKDSLKVNVNSTGYGLAFVKAVVEAHNGRVWAESEGKNKGSTFYIELPLK